MVTGQKMLALQSSKSQKEPSGSHQIWYLWRPKDEFDNTDDDLEGQINV